MKVRTGRAPGRPTKKNEQAIARILAVARSGLPLRFAAQAGNIDEDTLSLWRAKDPEFARALSQAQLHAVEERWKLIRKAAEERLDSNGNLLKPGDWKAKAWQLERRYPSDFGRPEVQLNVQNNVGVNATTINATDFQTVVVSDLEYLQLREQDNYEHPSAANAHSRG